MPFLDIAFTTKVLLLIRVAYQVHQVYSREAPIAQSDGLPNLIKISNYQPKRKPD